MNQVDHEHAVPLSSPDISEVEIQAVADVLRTGRLSRGPQLHDFEQAVATRANRRHAIGVNSGTSGLHLCVRALDIGEGDEVITTPFSFIATTNCILFERAKPVFVDIDPASYNMDPASIEAAITPRTKAILPVEVFGNTAHFDTYEQIAKKHGLAMIEDCCEALGSMLDGRPAGSFGDCSVFGFYPNKQITTGEGGVIVTDREDILHACRNMRSQGKDDSSATQYPMLGYNYRMSEVNAVIGLHQMQRLDEIVAKRQQVANWYYIALADIEEIQLPPQTHLKTTSWFVYVIRLQDRFSPEDRDRILEALRVRGIGCEQYFFPIHVQPHVARIAGTQRGDMPESEKLSDRSIALPFFANMQPEQVKHVAESLKTIMADF